MIRRDGYSDVNSVMIGCCCLVSSLLVAASALSMLSRYGHLLTPRQRLQVGAALLVPLAGFALAFNLHRLMRPAFEDSGGPARWVEGPWPQHRLAIYGFILVANLALYQALEALAGSVVHPDKVSWDQRRASPYASAATAAGSGKGEGTADQAGSSRRY